MRVSEWEVFLKQVLSHVKFKYDHNSIYFELLWHMEERYEDFRQEGMTEEDAQKAVLLCMGDADEIGQELNRAHSPIIGWIWRILYIIAILLVVLSFIPMVQLVVSLPISIFSSYEDYEEGKLVYTIAIEEKVGAYDTAYYLKELRYYDDNTLEIRFAIWQNPFSESVKYTGSVGMEIFDEGGNRYFESNGFVGGRYYERGQVRVRDVPLEAQEAVISYDSRGKLSIDISQGRRMVQ